MGQFEIPANRKILRRSKCLNGHELSIVSLVFKWLSAILISPMSKVDCMVYCESVSVRKLW